MLFYTSLFLFCIAISAVVVWLCRSMAAIGKAAYRAFLPSSKSNQKAKLRTVNLSDGLANASTPWGWKSQGSTRRAVPVSQPSAQTNTGTAPWGWPGAHKQTAKQMAARRKAESTDRSLTRTLNTTKKATVGWPYREEQFEFSGKQYKITRKRKVEKTKVSKVNRPWGW